MLDMHMHSVHSDGTRTVSEILDIAEEKELEIISITDHNSINAYDDLKNCRQKFSGKIVRGVELTTSFAGEIIEILAYDIDIEKMRGFIADNFYTQEQKLQEELDIIVNFCKEKGIIINEERMRNTDMIGGRSALYEEIKLFPENDKFFLDISNKATRTSFIRKEVGNRNSPLYIDFCSMYPTVPQIIDAIHSCGGKAFLAHAGVYTPQIMENLDTIVGYGLDGIECCYTDFSAETTDFLTNYAEKHGFLKSGGSDFHGTDFRPKSIMGKPDIEYNFCKEWLSECNFI